MTNEEKLAKMCSIVHEIDREEEAKAAANKHHNDELKELWTKLKSVANEDTRQTEMNLGQTGKPEAEGTIIESTAEPAGDSMKAGTHFEIVGGGRKKLPPAPAAKKAAPKKAKK